MIPEMAKFIVDKQLKQVTEVGCWDGGDTTYLAHVDHVFLIIRLNKPASGPRIWTYKMER